MAKYYQVISDDDRFPDRWFLTEPRSSKGEVIDCRLFRYGKPYTGITPITIPIRKPGLQVAFNLGAFDMPVISTEVLVAIKSVTKEDYESYPVKIGHTRLEYHILNATTQIECVDERKSNFTKWQPSDDRPDKLGEYNAIYELHIVPQNACGHHIFRVKGWIVALIVSEEIKEQLWQIDSLGIQFRPV